jgi:DNA-nicking Smr family endonuclease
MSETDNSQPGEPNNSQPVESNNSKPGEPNPVQIPIEDFLDLHTFLPKEIPSLLQDYLEACRERQIYEVRIIHGKGTGVLRGRVHSILKASSLVESFSLAPMEAGSWGATIVVLKR